MDTWIALTASTSKLVEPVRAKVIAVVGTLDLQYADADKARIKELAPERFVSVPEADHHLLTHGALAPSTVDLVGAALDALLVAPPAS